MDDGSATTIAGGGNCSLSQDSRWLMCRHTSDASVSIAPVSSPLTARRVQIPTAMRSFSLSIRPSKAGARAIHRVVAIAPASQALVGVGTPLRANAVTANGDELSGVKFRWSLVDSTQGRISDGGLLVPAEASS